jgi:predicted helicase
MVERLGIVYTPVEVVDFIIHSVDDALRQEFGASLSDKGVHVLDPFTGTGTFMVRLLQSGLIKSADLLHKYQNELHANELVLLAYYIAAINIEETYHDIAGDEFLPFEGIVLTDTFQMTESAGMNEDLIFAENNQRAAKQKKQPIRVIIGNPPYSAQQERSNDNNQNLAYPRLDSQIAGTYAAASNSPNVKNLYDSYVRAIRWATDRIKDKGIVCFVTNGSFIDSNNMDGLRKCLVDEYTSVYCFNLRGNQRTSGERSRQEGGKIFGSGSRAPIAVTLMVKNPAKSAVGGLFYYDIGDYLSRDEKMKQIAGFKSFANIDWQTLHPNSDGDWTNRRDPAFQSFMSLGDKSGDNVRTIFDIYSLGIGTNRDAWTYNFGADYLAKNMRRTISFFNKQSAEFVEYKSSAAYLSEDDEDESVGKFIDKDPRKISWTRSLKNELSKGSTFEFDENCIVKSSYRPFCKQWLYFNRRLNEYIFQMLRLFPKEGLENLVISLTGIGASREFSAVMTDCIPNLHLHDTGQCFPLYRYIEDNKSKASLFESESPYVRKDAISDTAIDAFRGHYDKKISKEDVFYYVYGILHSPEYKTRFASDLKKMLPRIPYAKDFSSFSKAGRKLAKWHLEYETVDPYPVKEMLSQTRVSAKERYQVTKMSFGKKDGKPDKAVILYNGHVTLSGIPLEAYEYIVNGKPALEWIMERYQVTEDKDSGIKNDPNKWSDDPRYIVDLVKRMVRVSLETVKIVNGLPALQEHVS